MGCRGALPQGAAREGDGGRVTRPGPWWRPYRRAGIALHVLAGVAVAAGFVESLMGEIERSPQRLAWAMTFVCAALAWLLIGLVVTTLSKRAWRRVVVDDDPRRALALLDVEFLREIQARKPVVWEVRSAVRERSRALPTRELYALLRDPDIPSSRGSRAAEALEPWVDPMSTAWRLSARSVDVDLASIDLDDAELDGLTATGPIADVVDILRTRHRGLGRWGAVAVCRRRQALLAAR